MKTKQSIDIIFANVMKLFWWIIIEYFFCGTDLLVITLKEAEELTDGFKTKVVLKVCVYCGSILL